jgi:hypothetical protein
MVHRLNILKSTIFDSDGHLDFNAVAMDLFSIHWEHNPVYRSFVEALGAPLPHNAHQIPALPIEAFKRHRVVLNGFHDEVTFTSSGTTGAETSRHGLPSIELYDLAWRTGFEARFGPAEGWAHLCLLPAYLERQGSSLVHMAEGLVRLGRPGSGFFLYDHQALADQLQQLEQRGQPALLWGVSFALLDFAAAHPMPLRHTTVIETGGMKGRRREMIRAELHAILHQAFGTVIESEYGMTELLSQAYTTGGLFQPPPWMRAEAMEPDDPLTACEPGKTGLLRITDLANLYSCPFIQTQDLGKVHPDGRFEVLGRFDLADVRGCNLMVS